MRLIGLISLLCVSAGVASAPTDLTIRTRLVYTRWHDAPVETVTVQTSGTRQRREWQTEHGGKLVSSMTQILDCDLHRSLVLDDLGKLYRDEPVRPPPSMTAALTAARGRSMADTRPVVETRTFDAVDTGERRRFGPLLARHVITTTTAERPGAAPKVVNVRDGWYVDAPPRDCHAASGEATALVAGEVHGRIEVRWRGIANAGYPIEERTRTFEGTGELEQRIELLNVSDAPIPRSAFEVPDGYRPALPLPGGGYDLTRPDTIVNRVTVWWNTASSWVASFWR